jgi:hypothetical protein
LQNEEQQEEEAQAEEGEAVVLIEGGLDVQQVCKPPAVHVDLAK